MHNSTNFKLESYCLIEAVTHNLSEKEKYDDELVTHEYNEKNKLSKLLINIK